MFKDIRQFPYVVTCPFTCIGKVNGEKMHDIVEYFIFKVSLLTSPLSTNQTCNLLYYTCKVALSSWDLRRSGPKRPPQEFAH